MQPWANSSCLWSTPSPGESRRSPRPLSFESEPSALGWHVSPHREGASSALPCSLSLFRRSVIGVARTTREGLDARVPALSCPIIIGRPATCFSGSAPSAMATIIMLTSQGHPYCSTRFPETPAEEFQRPLNAPVTSRAGLARSLPGGPKGRLNTPVLLDEMLRHVWQIRFNSFHVIRPARFRVCSPDRRPRYMGWRWTRACVWYSARV